MKVAFIVCCLFAVVYYCHGSCWVIPPTSGQNNVYDTCFFAGEIMYPGSTITRNCMSCFCGHSSGGYLKCCTVGNKVKKIPDDCKKIVSSDGCYEHVVKASDESSSCEYGVSMVGR
ncbi:uncharacterized protein LOC134713851 [Mytilus trossulus]|uniref:uncharacterized protein LOC134713851 n=1 Tax=Mytilus trossulus TaxID=6551 RepID=UPI003005A609